MLSAQLEWRTSVSVRVTPFKALRGRVRVALPSLVQLGLDVDGLGFVVGEVTRAGRAVELALPG